MLKNNHWFICVGCNKDVAPANKTSRNHCPYCFLCLHVDTDLPGDRASDCGAPMIPVSYIVKNWTIKIQFICTKCMKIHNNKISDDDEIGYLDQSIIQRKRKYPNVWDLVD